MEIYNETNVDLWRFQTNRCHRKNSYECVCVCFFRFFVSVNNQLWNLFYPQNKRKKNTVSSVCTPAMAYVVWRVLMKKYSKVRLGLQKGSPSCPHSTSNIVSILNVNSFKDVFSNVIFRRTRMKNFPAKGWRKIFGERENIAFCVAWLNRLLCGMTVDEQG